jgi:nickel-dependent lactate racemase
MKQKVDIAYGRGRIPLLADDGLADWRVIRPFNETALPDPAEEFRRVCASPENCAPLRTFVPPSAKVVIVTADGTRPVPNRQLIPWLLEELPVPVEQVTVLLGTGTHRPNTDAELAEMFGTDTVGRVKVINHDAFDPAANATVGTTEKGEPVSLAKIYVEADVRILVGFIEPHFFAGFSGGAKAVIPGIASIDTIGLIHRAELIAHPDCTWGVLEGNPMRREIDAMAAMCEPHFLVNVTLNLQKEISAIFAGHWRNAHQVGCTHVKQHSMAKVDRKFPLVITSNSGYPLDQNLYQTVKGISAAARIVEDGGTIIVASECSDGIPAHGKFAQLMRIGSTPREIVDWALSQKKTELDQWQAQTLASILQKASVKMFCQMPRAELEAMKLEKIEDLQKSVDQILSGLSDKRVAVLPDGPLTIPYLAG